MLEWLKRHAWKACKLQKGFGGSNPPLSAKILKTTCLSLFKHGGRKIFARMPSADCGVFEVGERSEVGVLESPAKLGSLEILDILAQHERKRIKTL